jgi:hypothetical protein
MLVSYTKERAPFLNSLSSSPLLDSESKPTFFRWVVTPHSRPLAESPPSDAEGSAAPLVPGMGLVYAKLQDTVQQELARMASAPPVAAAAAVAAPVAVPVTAAAAPVAVPVAAAAAIADDEVKAEAAAALVGAKRAASSADAGARKRPASGSSAASAPRIAPFVRKLYDMVSAGNECIRWAQDGTSFWIGAPDALESTVLPRFFKHNRMAFFVKQLKAYGFCAKRGASCLDVSKEWFHKVQRNFWPRNSRNSCAQLGAILPLFDPPCDAPLPPLSTGGRLLPRRRGVSRQHPAHVGPLALARRQHRGERQQRRGRPAGRPVGVAAGDDGDGGGGGGAAGGLVELRPLGLGRRQRIGHVRVGRQRQRQRQAQIGERRRPRLVERLVGRPRRLLRPHLEWPQLVGSQLVGADQLRGAVGEPERVERPWIGEWRLGLERDVVGALVVAALGRRPRGAEHDARGAHRRRGSNWGRRARPHASHTRSLPPQAHRGGLHEHATNAFAMLDAIAARLGQNRASGPPPEVGETPSTAAVAATEGISILGSQMEGIAA